MVWCGLDTIVALWIATQWVAAGWQYHPQLGTPLWITADGAVRIYAPYSLLEWALRYQHIPAATPGLRTGWVVFSVAVVCLIVATLVLRRSRDIRTPSDSHGTAQWGTGETLRAAQGLVLGRWQEQPLRYHGPGHLVTVAPTRAGKGTSAIIPNLLLYPGAMIVTDPKGENYAVTAARRRALGHTVYACDPFQVIASLGLPSPPSVAAFNPLDLIDATAPDAIDDARLIADMLVVTENARQQSGEQAFWTEEARGVFTGIILYVAAHRTGPLRTLTHVRELLTLPPDEFTTLLQHMRASDAVGGLVARSAARLLQKADKERSGVISSAQSHSHFLDSPRMAHVLGESTVPLHELTTAPITVYLIVPPDRLTTYQRWLRLMLACCLLCVTRQSASTRRLTHRVVFLLDEFAHLGRMAPVEDAISLVAGYGATLWLFVQDFAQLKYLYGERWQSFVANADVLQAFGIADQDTAEYCSKLTGDATIHVASDNASRSIARGRSRGRQESTAQTVSEKGRRLLLPDEVRRLSGQLLFPRGQAPLHAELLSYLHHPVLHTMADANPYAAVSTGDG